MKIIKKILSFVLPIGVLIFSGVFAAFGFCLRYNSNFPWGPFVGFLLLLATIVAVAMGTFLLWKKLGNFSTTEKERIKIIFFVVPTLLLSSFAFFSLVIIPLFRF